MTEEREPLETPASPSAGNTGAPRVRTLLICDLVDSTALVERLGDIEAPELLRRHDRLARDLLHLHNGREIDKTDGFLALFERPIEAVAFALAYQRALRTLGEETKQPLRARVGVHVGEVVVWENNAVDIAGGAKRLDVEGLAKPVVARLMALALPGQIILSGIAFSLAQRAERELERPTALRWLTHGRYRFKGVAAPMLVHEVGEVGVAPLQAPPSGAKAEKEVPLWRKPIVIALEAIAVLVAIAVPVVLSLRAPPAIAFGERDWIVMAELNNLTGETLLDDSLETAFRISLEQSRYVNVLSDLKLRDTLARMQKPGDTAIDRGIASEIALREGARAVILATVAEIGGRVRVSAEVIDPHTQTTVYAESADGVGAASTLDSIDSVTHTLREKLGETLASIEQDSAPLPKVTSANLDALRAYALGVEAWGRSDYATAAGLFDQALALDPKFALAHIGHARLLWISEDFDAASAAAERALALRDRLTARDALYVDAWNATFGPTAPKLEKWRLLGQLYPDYYAAHYNYALFAFGEASRFKDSLDAIALADAPQNPFRDEAVYLRGANQLGLNQIDAALESFRIALQLGMQGKNVQYAHAEMALRDFDAASGVLRDAVVAIDTVSRRDRLEAQVVAEIDQGRLAAAEALEYAAATAGQPADPLRAGDSAGATLVRVILGFVRDARETSLATVQIALEQAIATQPGTRSESDVRADRLVMLAYLAARLDAGELAERAMTIAGPVLERSGRPNREDMLRVARAEVLRAVGNPEQALDLLNGVIDGTDPYQAHSARFRVYRALGQLERALSEAQWLESSRGRAYVGVDVLSMMRPMNVVDANLASIDAAEIALELGRLDLARIQLEAFRSHWPELEAGSILSERAQTLERRLVPPDVSGG